MVVAIPSGNRSREHIGGDELPTQVQTELGLGASRTQGKDWNMNRRIIIPFLVGVTTGIVTMTLGSGITVHAQPPAHQAYSISAAANGVYIVSTKGSIAYCGPTLGTCVLVRGDQY